MIAPACPRCGSSSARRVFDPTTGDCMSRKGCHARRCQRRYDEDRRRSPGAQQCMASIGRLSIRFCMMREGHAGPHLNDSTEWNGTSTPVGDKLRAKLRSGGAS